MRKLLHRAGNVYKSIIMKYIGIFIFVGILSVVFNDHGWFPNGDIYAISQLVYWWLLPCMLGYSIGNAVMPEGGGIVAVLATVGIVAAEPQVGMFGAMIAGPAGGYICKPIVPRVLKAVKPGLQMLIKNMLLAMLGTGLTLMAYYRLSPVLLIVRDGLSAMMDYLIAEKLIILSSILIEPAKILFLNNSINFGILFPMAMQQVQETGSSVLFLLETNPGPGFGVLAALYFMRRERREQYAASMFVQGLGGIHEVYFPFVLSNLWLLSALILGGLAGNFCFLIMHAGLQGVVSPGSVLTIVLMAGKSAVTGVVTGILVSALVSFGVGLFILKMQMKYAGKECAKTELPKEEETEKWGFMRPIRRIGFVCDAGVGSSVMGASLLRRKLHQQQIAEMEVQAYAADQIDEGLDMIVCQKDFVCLLPEMGKACELYTMDHFLNTENYNQLLEILKQRNG